MHFSPEFSYPANWLIFLELCIKKAGCPLPSGQPAFHKNNFD